MFMDIAMLVENQVTGRACRGYACRRGESREGGVSPPESCRVLEGHEVGQSLGMCVTEKQNAHGPGEGAHP